MSATITIAKYMTPIIIRYLLTQATEDDMNWSASLSRVGALYELFDQYGAENDDPAFFFKKLGEKSAAHIADSLPDVPAERIEAIGRNFARVLEEKAMPLLLSSHFQADAFAKAVQQIELDAYAFDEAERPHIAHALTYAGRNLYELAETIPHFTRETLGKLLVDQARTFDSLDAIFKQTYGEVTAERNTHFEGVYKRRLKAKLDRLELFGLQNRDECVIPISVAYISLIAQARRREKQTEMRHERHGEPQQIEAILAQHRRMFIEGRAGAGKTTLLKRIAVMMAADELPSELAHLRGYTPFFVRLRDYVDKPIGKVWGDLVATYHISGHDRVADDWITERLRHGRVAVLVDGFDEITQAKREEVNDWLDGLFDSVGVDEAVYVLSGRPEAAEKGSAFDHWLQTHAFTHITLAPMGDHQIRAFVSQWHDAMAQAPLPAETIAALPTQAAKLHKILTNETYAHLQTLAETPLLCALICALHQRGWDVANVKLPDLYQAAIEMFLGRRDSDRKTVDMSRYAPLPELEEWKMALQEVAFWMIDVNGNTTIAKDDLRRELANNVTLQMKGCEPDKLMRYLVERANLFGAVDGETLEFVHRSFLEYLAAQWVVYKGKARQVTWLVQKFPQEAWHGTLKMVAYAKDEKVQLALMAALDDPAANWLKAVESENRQERVTVEEVRVSRHRRALELFYCMVSPSLALWEWHQTHVENAIETDEDGDLVLVLNNLPITTLIWVQGSARLEAVQALNLSGTAVSDLTALQNMTKLQVLRLDGTVVSDLTALQNMKQLRELELNSTLVSNLAPLQNMTQLQVLWLSGTAVSDLTALQNMTQLQGLGLNGTAVNDLTVLQNMTKLQRLYLNGTAVNDLSPLQNMTQLQVLWLSSTAISDFTVLRNMTQLQWLHLNDTAVSDLTALQNMTQLRWLDLDGTAVSDLTALQNMTQLQELWLIGTAVSDLTALQNMTQLQELDLNGTAVSDEQIAALQAALPDLTIHR